MQLQEREHLFLTEVNKQEYPQSIKDEFFEYWSEPDKKGRMRFELEKTWDLKRRLKRWSLNNNKWNGKNNNNSISGKLLTTASKDDFGRL